MFIRVEPDEFVVGTKYKMGQHTGTYVDRGCTIYGIWHYGFNLQGRERFVISSLVFYRFVSDQPQWNMERRAVNLVLRRLIGDETFEW
jgi:hypothetical protein